ncbi:MAG TPA: hypothetical protein VIG97_10500 [Luteimonas sp.]
MTTQHQAVGQGTANQPRTEHQHLPLAIFARRAVESGSLASVLSTLVVSAFSRSRSGATAAGTNAASQWFWYPRARHVDRPSLRYTAVGYGVHHASSLLWGTAFEALRPREATAPGRAVRASAVALGAYVVDYHVVRRRLSPGFENRIGAAGVLAAYSVFALGLYIAASRVSARKVARQACIPRGDGDAGPISRQDQRALRGARRTRSLHPPG